MVTMAQLPLSVGTPCPAPAWGWYPHFRLSLENRALGAGRPVDRAVRMSNWMANRQVILRIGLTD